MEGKEKKMEEKVLLPEGVSASLDDNMLILKKQKGEVKKKFHNPYVDLELKGNEVFFKATRNTKREKKIIGSFVSHLKNMIKGVTEGHKYVLKVCSGHFPINVSVSGEELIVKNFFGEKTPRVLKLKKGASVKVDGDEIVVESEDKEIAGQVSADIEQLTRRTGYDSRIFQDGCYIIIKDGKPIK
ncbi:50S ribosomal protein L6 [Candidatus Woesearchaeota archaeon]|nr:50S ribosomal protein L6 [Candidatus Woesearchaeota archaeon]